jgi:orotate phosphoribosyltransferase
MLCDDRIRHAGHSRCQMQAWWCVFCYLFAMTPSEDIAGVLLASGAVQLRPDQPFLLASGLRSPVYCDCRVLYGRVAARDKVVAALVDRLRDLPCDVVAGTATSGIGWGAVLAHELRQPFVYVRAQPKAHGTGQRIEGGSVVGQRAVVVEDLLSTGGSAEKTIAVLRAEGQACVADVLSIVTYGQPESLAMAGRQAVTLHSLTTMQDVLAAVEAQQALSREALASVRSFLVDPLGWQQVVGS